MARPVSPIAPFPRLPPAPLRLRDGPPSQAIPGAWAHCSLVSGNEQLQPRRGRWRFPSQLLGLLGVSLGERTLQSTVGPQPPLLLHPRKAASRLKVLPGQGCAPEAPLSFSRSECTRDRRRHGAASGPLAPGTASGAEAFCS